MIVTAFAHGERDTLRPLLSDDVFATFDQEIKARESKKERVDFTFLELKAAAITAAELKGTEAEITVTFESEVMLAGYDPAGALIEGDAKTPHRVSERWTTSPTIRGRATPIGCSSPRRAAANPADRPFAMTGGQAFSFLWLVRARQFWPSVIFALALAGCMHMAPQGVAPLRLTQISFADLEGWKNGDPEGALAGFRRSCGALAKRPDGAALGGLYAGTAADWRAPCATRAKYAGNARGFFEANFRSLSYRAKQRERPLHRLLRT